MKMKKLKVNPVKTFGINSAKVHFNLDTDKDGVLDHKDCRPFNKKLQHVRPNRQMRKEIKSLPIYVSPKPSYGFGYTDQQARHHILSKEAKREAPKLTQTVLSTIKKYPNIIGEIKRSKPKDITYAKKIDTPSAHGVTDVQSKRIAVATDRTLPVSKIEARKWTNQSKEFLPKRMYNIQKERFNRDIFVDEPLDVRRKKIKKALASTTFHELKHVKQIKNYPTYDDFADKYRIQEKSLGGENPFEIEAHEEAIQQIKKREEKSKKPTGEEITKTLILDEDEKDENEEDEY